MPDWRETDMRRIYSMQDLRTREMSAFSSIPGMYELMQADPDQKEEIGAQYPDAAFATMIAGSIFNHNHQLGEITQRAYFSILEGESIGSVRFAYERATDEYWKIHMWDD